MLEKKRQESCEIFNARLHIHAMLWKAATVALTFIIVTPCTEEYFHPWKIVSPPTENSWCYIKLWPHIPETSGFYWRTMLPCELLKSTLHPHFLIYDKQCRMSKYDSQIDGLSQWTNSFLCRGSAKISLSSEKMQGNVQI